jgi:tRNA uridine 5-carboxymethylaminomethyl modification enzyme
LKRLRILVPETESSSFDDPQVAEQVEIHAKYEGYIERQRLEVARTSTQDNEPIPPDFDFASVPSLSHEVLQKLQAVRPETIGQAGRISGVTPAAISLLLVTLKRHRKRSAAHVDEGTSGRGPGNTHSAVLQTQTPVPAGGPVPAA